MQASWGRKSSEVHAASNTHPLFSLSEIVAGKASDNAVEGSLSSSVFPCFLCGERSLFLRPLRHAPRSPRRSSGLHVFLQFRKIDIDKCFQLRQLIRELRRRNPVRINIGLCRLGHRESLTLDDRSHAIADGRRHRLISLGEFNIPLQGPRYLTIPLLERIRDSA